MLLQEGVEAYKKEGPKFMQRLVAKWRTRGAVAKEYRPLPGILRQSSKYSQTVCYNNIDFVLHGDGDAAVSGEVGS
jgi:hypothetical protein